MQSHHHATPRSDRFSRVPQTQQIAAGLQHPVLVGWCRFRDVTICPISALVDLSLMEFGSPGSVTEASLCRHVVRAPNSPGSQRLASGTLSKHMRKALEDAGELLQGSHWASGTLSKHMRKALEDPNLARPPVPRPWSF